MGHFQNCVGSRQFALKAMENGSGAWIFQNYDPIKKLKLHTLSRNAYRSTLSKWDVAYLGKNGAEGILWTLDSPLVEYSIPSWEKCVHQISWHFLHSSWSKINAFLVPHETNRLFNFQQPIFCSVIHSDITSSYSVGLFSLITNRFSITTWLLSHSSVAPKIGWWSYYSSMMELNVEFCPKCMKV